jgi:uncharacterized protein (TIGR01777 family)
MKIIIPGGSGHLGALLAREYHARGHEVVVLSRNPIEAPWRTVAWKTHSLVTWPREFDGADVVINLAGRSVNCRYTAKNRREIVQSRVDSTRAVGAAIAQAKHPPRLWLQAGTATIYAHRYDAPNDELSGIIDTGEGAPDTWRFSLDVAKAWEDAVHRSVTPHTRKVILRTAMVMGPERDGVFDVLAGLARRGLGGRMGDGRQYVSWIHEQDFVRAIDWIIEHEELAGAINLCAPRPLPNVEFMRELRRAIGVRAGLPAAKWMLELGAVFMRTETELILKSRHVIPTRLLQTGFVFQYPKWKKAVVDLAERWQQGSEFRVHAAPTPQTPA